ncbi:MAG: ABC transporter ATP-binding protein [Geminicoccaceae bacterium]|nr:MAG: ABC transporter ATP-binding protein [Geminicoccaceae bacterium]
MFESRRPDQSFEPLLELRAVSAGYPTGRVLYDLDLTVGDGEVVALLGRNGMGKTTTLLTIMGRIRPETGSISFAGRRLNELPPFRIARLGIGLVPEGRQVFANLTVRENLLAVARVPRGDRPGWTVEAVFDLFPRLAERADQLAHRLSGGEQQMLAIGRALMTNPRLLLLDEATEGLAPLVRREIWNVLGQLKKDGHSILVVDKNVAALAQVADRFCVLEKGRLVWEGRPEALLAARDVVDRYLGV